ncbi:MAG: hypothetical protein IS860_06370 [Nitrosopumilus sp.]|nr:hypothetical protein [Nitrosopumilus sp.]
MYDKLYDYFEEGIKNSERCVFLTTENDANQVYEKLKGKLESSKVIKYFSYYTIPDPINIPKEFKKKMEILQDTVFDKTIPRQDRIQRFRRYD